MQVDLALVPAVSGDFGVMPGHVPTIAELRPGVVAVHKELDKDVEKYFVSGGFAFAHADSSVELTAVEATKVEDIDPAAVKAGLAEYTARYDTGLFLLAQHQHSHCPATLPMQLLATSSGSLYATSAGVAESVTSGSFFRLASASGKNDDMEAAIAQIGIEVYSAMDAALQ